MDARLRLSYDIAEYKRRLRRARILQESNLLCCCWSPCGNFVFAGSNFGSVASWSASEVLLPRNHSGASESQRGVRKPPRAPIANVSASDGPVYDLDLLGGGETLVCVTEEELLLFDASALSPAEQDPMEVEGASQPNAPVQVQPKLRIAAQFFSARKARKAVMRPEFNCVSKGAKSGGDGRFVVVGCGDGSLRSFDVERGGDIVDTREGHQRAVQAISRVAEEPHSLVSASEDGCFGLWDMRQSSALVRTVRIDGGGHSNVWAASCAVDADSAWALIGGGIGDGVGSGYGVGGYAGDETLVGDRHHLAGIASVVHLATGRILETVPRAVPVQAVAATQRGWIVGGRQNVQTMPPVKLASAVEGEARTTAPAVFAMSVAPNMGADAPLVVCGASPYVDLFAYPGHRSAVLGL